MMRKDEFGDSNDRHQTLAGEIMSTVDVASAPVGPESTRLKIFLHALLFAAGLLSFLSPCVLPLVPAYLGYLSGHTFQRS